MLWKQKPKKAQVYPEHYCVSSSVLGINKNKNIFVSSWGSGGEIKEIDVFFIFFRFFCTEM